MLKRILISLGVVVLALACAIGAVLYVAFAHNRPLVDGQELAPGIHVVKDGFVSLVLIDLAPGKVALVDAGNDKAGTSLLAALKSRGLSADTVQAIFLTHGHPDHVAACHLFPRAGVYALASEVALIGRAAQVDHALHDGDIVQVGGLRVEPFAVPGHTAGSAAYLIRGVLFLGDSANGAKDGSVLPAVRLFSKDPAQNVASLKALASRLSPRAPEIKTLAFAHSGPLQGFSPLAAFASRN